MLRSLKDLERYTVSATDGDIGSVMDVLLDDERWVARYLVVQASGSLFLGGRRVLISPISFREVDWSTHRFHLALTSDKVKNAPSVNMDKPVSRQHERDYYGYYGYSHYWGYPGYWGVGIYPGPLSLRGQAESSDEPTALASDDVHLRSAKEVRGYHIQGSDDTIGHVDDFIVDDETWAVRYLVVDTSNWWFGKKVLISPQWAGNVSWENRKVYLDMPRQTIKESPEWDPSEAVNREYEVRLYDYHGRPAYWLDSSLSALSSGEPRPVVGGSSTQERSGSHKKAS